jgi:TolB-like protein
MTHHRMRNNRVAAIEEYARLEAHLRSRHDLAPGEAAQAALRAARDDGTAARPAHAASPPTAPRPAQLVQIAVARFSGAPGQSAHLIDGFRSELLGNLARFREWSVIDDDGERRGPAALPAASAGHYLVQGACLDTADGPRLRVRLQDIRRRRLVWSDDLSISLQDWASLQRSVVGRIAAHLETYISADRLQHAIGGDGQDALSHDTWLRAEQIFARWTPEAADEAEALLSRLIDRDDGFAPAFASLAGFRNVQHVVRPGRPRDAAGARQAQVFAQRAVELDPLDARNHLALAWTAALADAFDRAAIHLDLAVSLNPNCATTLVSCAMAFAFVGQPDRAQALVAHVLRISPLLRDYQWCYVASVYFLSGRYDEALNAARLSGDRIVDNRGWTAAALARLGRTEAARQDFGRLIDAVRPVWAGRDPPTAEAVFEWFTGAYPLRRPADREALRAALEAAMRGQ